MRLSDDESREIVAGVLPFIADGVGAELLLYGSRAIDSRRGGDIDLLLIVDGDAAALDRIKSLKLDIVVEWKRRLGDRKIDFRIATRDEAAADAFLQTVVPSAVTLHRWR